MTVMPVLGHYGGIDEIGIFLIPAVAVVLVLRWADARARRRAPDGDQEGDGVDEVV